jgi:hypothetical protein
MDSLGYLYLLVNTENPRGVFKVGRAKRDPVDRLSEYPKGSYFVDVFKCTNHVDAEYGLIRAMKCKFPVYRGREYFNGGENELMDFFGGFCRSTPCPMEID